MHVTAIETQELLLDVQPFRILKPGTPALVGHISSRLDGRLQLVTSYFTDVVAVVVAGFSIYFLVTFGPTSLASLSESHCTI